MSGIKAKIAETLRQKAADIELANEMSVIRTPEELAVFAEKGRLGLIHQHQLLQAAGKLKGKGQK